MIFLQVSVLVIFKFGKNRRVDQANTDTLHSVLMISCRLHTYLKNHRHSTY